MKNACFILSLLCAALLISPACKKEQQHQTTDRNVLATVVIPANPTLQGVLGTGRSVIDTIRLTSNVEWHLNGLVYVDVSDVLIIDSGTVIKGNLSSRPDVPGGGLVIVRGAKILAEGTATNPIIFTSAAATPQPGDWAGVIIIGNASSNNVGRTRVEGMPSNPPVDATYGGTVGTNDADNSGIFKFVRIEYAGWELTQNDEINGLTLAGVGSGTVIDYVESFKALDDAFEFFGGTVTASHLIAADARDDLFDFDNGYRGTIRYALGLADTSRADISQSNGIECDNSIAIGIPAPITKPNLRSITIIGLRTVNKATQTNMPPSGAGRYGRAAFFRRYAEFDIDSAIFLGYNFGISLDSSVSGNYRANHLSWLTHTVSHAYYGGGTPVNISRYITESFPAGNPVTGASFGITTPGSFYNFAIADGNYTTAIVGNIALVNPFNRSAATNFRTVPGTPGTFIAGGGAFPGGINWATGSWPRFQ